MGLKPKGKSAGRKKKSPILIESKSVKGSSPAVMFYRLKESLVKDGYEVRTRRETGKGKETYVLEAAEGERKDILKKDMKDSEKKGRQRKGMIRDEVLKHFVTEYDGLYGKKYRATDLDKKQIGAALKRGETGEELKFAITNMANEYGKAWYVSRGIVLSIRGLIKHLNRFKVDMRVVSKKNGKGTEDFEGQSIPKKMWEEWERKGWVEDGEYVDKEACKEDYWGRK